jgi:hypothetical protein
MFIVRTDHRNNIGEELEQSAIRLAKSFVAFSTETVSRLDIENE